MGCGFGTCAHESGTGRVSVGLPSGDSSTGGGPIGLLKKQENWMTFEGRLRMPSCGLSALTAKTRANQLPSNGVDVAVAVGRDVVVPERDDARRHVAQREVRVVRDLEAVGHRIRDRRPVEVDGLPGVEGRVPPGRRQHRCARRPGPAPVTVKLRVVDHALGWPAPSTAWTRQK